MSTYGTVQDWLKNQPGEFFPLLDEEGQSSFVEGSETALFLFVQPEEPQDGDDPIYMYMPLTSVIGLRDEPLWEFMTDMLEANMVGALPTGYRLFYDRVQKHTYLGGQFSPNGLDATAFRQLAEDFVRYGRVEMSRWAERLAELAREFSGLPAAAPATPAPASAPDATVLSPSQLMGFIRA